MTLPIHPVFLDDTVNRRGDTVNDSVNDTVKQSQLTRRQLDILSAIEENDRISSAELCIRLAVSRPTISRAISDLKKKGVILRVGSDKSGSWFLAKKVK